jgi:hypothetical protein
MGKIIDLHKHTSLTFANDVRQIAKPLLEVNTDYFCFVRIFRDRSRICLTNNGEDANL